MSHKLSSSSPFVPFRVIYVRRSGESGHWSRNWWGKSVTSSDNAAKCDHKVLVYKCSSTTIFVYVYIK